MDAVAIASMMVASKAQAGQSQLSAILMKRQNEQDQALAGMLEAGLANGEALRAAAPEGTGTLLDVTV